MCCRGRAYEFHTVLRIHSSGVGNNMCPTLVRCNRCSRHNYRVGIRYRHSHFFDWQCWTGFTRWVVLTTYAGCSPLQCESSKYANLADWPSTDTHMYHPSCKSDRTHITYGSRSPAANKANVIQYSTKKRKGKSFFVHHHPFCRIWATLVRTTGQQ